MMKGDEVPSPPIKPLLLWFVVIGAAVAVYNDPSGTGVTLRELVDIVWQGMKNLIEFFSSFTNS